MDPPGAQLDVLSRMDPDTRAGFVHAGRTQELRAGHHLMLQGERSRTLFLLERGLTEVALSDADGGRQFVTFRAAGSVLGEFGALDGGRRSATVVALTPVRVRVYPVGGLHEFLDRHPEAHAALTSAVLAKTRAAVRRQFRYGHGEPAARIARVLVDHAAEYGRADTSDTSDTSDTAAIVLDVPLSRARIADLVHLSPSVVAKYLLGWSREGLLDTGYRGRRRVRLLDREGVMELTSAG